MKLSLLNKMGLSLLLVSYFYFSYVKFYNIPPHLLLIFLILACNLLNLKESVLSFGGEIKILFLGLFLVTAISAIFSYEFNSSNYKAIIEYIFKFGFLPVAIFLITDVSIKTKKDIDFFEKLIMVLSIITLSIAMFQFIGINWAWEVRMLIQGPGLNERLSKWFIEKKLPMGLAYHNITLTYQSLIFLSFIISSFLLCKEKIFLKRKNLILLFGFMIALILKSRSLFFGLGIAFLIAYILINKKDISRLGILKRVWKTLLICLALISIFIIFINYQHKAFFDYTFASRFYHFYAGINIFLHHPLFGIGNIPYEFFSPYYLSQLETYVPRHIYNEGVHNSFLSALLKNGIFILIPLFFIYKIWITSNAIFSVHHKQKYLFFLVYIIAYSFHSFFHNQGIFTGDQLFWLIFSFLVVSSNLHKPNLKK